MEKSAVVQGVDDIQRALGPVFKRAGFRKKGRTYNRLTADGLTQVVHFQSAGSYSALHGRFTVNLGVYVPEVGRLDYGAPPKFISEAYCTLRTRLAQTMGRTQDIWWPVALPEKVVEIATEWFKQGGFPMFLDRFVSRSVVFAYLDQDVDRVEFALTPNKIIAAQMLLHLGDVDRAQARMRAQYDWAMADGRPGHAETVLERAERWGIGWSS